MVICSGILVALAVACVIAATAMRPHITPAFLAPFAQWLLPLIVLGCLPFTIRGYAVTEDAILIRRLFWTTRLDRSGLVSAEVIPKAMAKSLRTCCNCSRVIDQRKFGFDEPGVAPRMVETR